MITAEQFARTLPAQRLFTHARNFARHYDPLAFNRNRMLWLAFYRRSLAHGDGRHTYILTCYPGGQYRVDYTHGAMGWHGDFYSLGILVHFMEKRREVACNAATPTT